MQVLINALDSNSALWGFMRTIRPKERRHFTELPFYKEHVAEVLEYGGCMEDDFYQYCYDDLIEKVLRLIGIKEMYILGAGSTRLSFLYDDYVVKIWYLNNEQQENEIRMFKDLESKRITAPIIYSNENYLITKRYPLLDDDSLLSETEEEVNCDEELITLSKTIKSLGYITGDLFRDGNVGYDVIRKHAVLLDGGHLFREDEEHESNYFSYLEQGNVPFKLDVSEYSAEHDSKVLDFTGKYNSVHNVTAMYCTELSNGQIALKLDTDSKLKIPFDPPFECIADVNDLLSYLPYDLNKDKVYKVEEIKTLLAESKYINVDLYVIDVTNIGDNIFEFSAAVLNIANGTKRRMYSITGYMNEARNYIPIMKRLNALSYQTRNTLPTVEDIRCMFIDVISAFAFPTGNLEIN